MFHHSVSYSACIFLLYWVSPPLSSPSYYSSNHLFVWPSVLSSVSHALLSKVPNTLTYISELVTYIHNSGLPSLTIATSLHPPLLHLSLSPSLILFPFHTLLLILSHPLIFIRSCLIICLECLLHFPFLSFLVSLCESACVYTEYVYVSSHSHISIDSLTCVQYEIF